MRPCPTSQRTSATTVSHEEIALAWTAPGYDGGSPITGYFIDYSTDDGATWQVERTNTNSVNTAYKHTGLEKATVHHYRVAAITSVGAGETSGIVEAKTHALAPGKPYDLIAEAVASTQIDLRWTPPRDDGGAPITEYLIEGSTDKQQWERLADVEDLTKYSHFDVTPGQTWHYRVSATNEAGTGLPSNVATATTDDPVQRTDRVIGAILPRFAAASVSSSIRRA